MASIFSPKLLTKQPQYPASQIYLIIKCLSSSHLDQILLQPTGRAATRSPSLDSWKGEEAETY